MLLNLNEVQSVCASAFCSRFFLFCRFLYQGYIGHLASPVHITKKISVVDTSLSISADQTESTNPLWYHAIRAWYTTNISPKVRCMYRQILFQFAANYVHRNKLISARLIILNGFYKYHTLIIQHDASYRQWFNFKNYLYKFEKNIERLHNIHEYSGQKHPTEVLNLYQLH